MAVKLTDVGVVYVKENEKSRDIVIEQRLHRLIIGSQGSRIREIRDQFPHVSIFIPDYARKSDVITLRGPRHDVDRCYTYLQKLCHELVCTPSRRCLCPSLFNCLSLCLSVSLYVCLSVCLCVSVCLLHVPTETLS